MFLSFLSNYLVEIAFRVTVCTVIAVFINKRKIKKRKDEVDDHKTNELQETLID